MIIINVASQLILDDFNTNKIHEPYSPSVIYQTLYLLILFYNKQQQKMIILYVCLVTYSQAITLGENLIRNGQFLEPDLISAALPYQYITSGIPGWTCASCDLQNCVLMIAFYQSQGANYGNCKGQSLDLSSTHPEIITQIFQATRGSYVLSIQYYLPIKYAKYKTLVIYFNQKEVYRHRPQLNSDSRPYNISLDLQSRTGKNNLTFNTEGMSDYFGFRLTSVEFRRKVDPQIQSFVQSSFNNYLLIGAISFSASRIILGDLVRFFISLDRLQFYSFHNRNHSYYTNMILKNITAIMDKKATSTFIIQEKILASKADEYKSFFSQLDYKYDYINSEVLSKSQNGYGFIINNQDLFIYSIAFYIISIAFLYLAFRITFNYRISKVLTKYSFFGAIFLLMICEGNIEQYSFYAFGEMKALFSLNYRHKLINSLIVSFCFTVFATSTVFYFLLWGQYKKLTKYFIDNVKLSLGGIGAYSLSHGFFCLLLGALHQLLLNFPNTQLLALGIVQIIWMGLQSTFLYRGLYNGKWILWIRIIQGLLQVVFQLSLFVYANTTDHIRSFLNEEIHLCQILLFIGLWILQLLGSILLFTKQCIKMLSQSSRIKKRYVKQEFQGIIRLKRRKQLFVQH